MRPIWTLGLLCLLFSTLGASCKTKRDIRREQEYEKIKMDVRDAKTTRADFEVFSEEIRTEITRLGTAVEEQGQHQRNQNDEVRKEVAALAARMTALEQQVAAANTPAPPAPSKGQKVGSYESAKELFDEGSFEEAAEEAKAIAKAKKPDSKKAQFLLAESYFAGKDFGAAALEFSEFKKGYPRDSNVPYATLRQAQSFRNLGKEKEARLFYQEVLEKFPKSPAAVQAKKDLKKLK